MAQRIDIIVNPAGGKGSSRSALQEAEAYLRAQDVPYTVSGTLAAGDASRIAADLCAAGSEKIAVIGGDGTFHEVLNGMDFSRARLGFVPAGRGNDYAGAAGLPLDAADAMRAIIAGVPADKDFIQVGGRRCLNVCGTGLDVEVLRLAASRKGRLAYTAALFRCLLRFRPYTIQVLVNGTLKECACVTAAVCNGSQYGGGIRVCPPARIDDGMLDLIVVDRPRFMPTLFVMPDFVRGRHMDKSYCTHIRCEAVKISTPQLIQLDGEIYDEHVLDVRVVPGGLKTYAV